MGQPSSPSSADDHVAPRRTPLRELIQLYRTEQAMLAAHQQEVERRRAAVRAAADEEAAEILLAAKREIRRVLVRTRHELVTLTAQVQAVGRETSPGQPEQPSLGDEFQLSATRDVRSVLRDARAELSTLSKDTSNFWPSVDEARLPAPAIATVPLPESVAADDFSLLAPQTSDGRVDDHTEDAPATGVADKIIKYWRPAAVVFAVIAFVLIMIVATRSSSPSEPAVTAPRPEPAGAAATAPAPEVPAATATPPTVQPATTQPPRARPPEPAGATGVTRGTTGQQPPTSVPATPRSAAETQTAQPNRAAPPAQDTAVAEREILERHQRWFQAFEHGDRATIASITSDNFSLVDQRPERAPTAGRVEHTIQDVRVRVTAGVGAVLSGRIAETTAPNQATVAMLSEVWIRQAEEWRLVSVRMVPLSAVATTLQ